MFSNSFVKIIALFAVLAVCMALWYKEQARRANELYTASQANNELLINKVKDIYNDKLETDRRNALLEQAAETENKEYFNWHADISNSPVIKQLQAN
jgi:hypothetical protein